MLKAATTALFAATVLTFAATVEAEDQKPSATVEIDELQIAFIASGQIGEGVLKHNGKEHKFTIGGLGVGGVGASEIKATGEVYSMDDVSQFAGIYGQARAGVAVINESTGGLWLINPDGVTVHLDGERQGLALSIGVDGIVVEMSE